MKCFRKTAGYTLFDHKRINEILEQLKLEPVDEKLQDRNQMATACNKNEHQRDAKNNAEL
jgi:hypothetical protein